MSTISDEVIKKLSKNVEMYDAAGIHFSEFYTKEEVKYIYKRAKELGLRL